jgi:nucleotide-binding universal stress UspA family protein
LIWVKQQSSQTEQTVLHEHSEEESPMYKHILIASDGSDLAQKAVRHGIAFAKEIGAKVTALTVSEPFHFATFDTAMIEDTSATYKTRIASRVATILGAVATAAKAAEIECATVHVEDEHPYKAIIEQARAKGCDLILMASHGRRGVSALVLGSETVKVLTHSKIPVLVYR